MAPLIALVLAACAESHDVEDAGRLDGGRRDASPFDAGRRDAARPDAGRPDATRPDTGAPDAGCLDEDGDGALGVACGGDDCDDRDPEISPGSSECDGPTTATRCEEGSLRTEECTAPEVCDARSGACSLDGCGDGVLHEGEECDDGNETRRDGCTASCAFEPCADSTVCPAHAPSCSDLRADGQVYCRATIVGGLPLGAWCGRSDECESGWCDERQGACEAACTTDDQCGAHSRPVCRRLFGWDQTRCIFGCFADADCPLGRGCFIGPTCPVTITYCLPSGATAFRGACSGRASECVGGICHPEGCSRLCRSDADCEGWACERFGDCEFPATWPDREVFWCRSGG